LKPFNELEILYAIEMAVESLCPNQCFLSEDKDTVISAEYLFVKKNKSLKKVLIEDIIYIEVEERYCNIITKKFVIMMSLTKMRSLIHRSSVERTGTLW
jgi:DNA-binding LytR/AlgR family response regulator